MEKLRSKPAYAPLQEPAKRWVNRWLVRQVSQWGCSQCERVEERDAGDIVETCCRYYPSRDLAETHAEELNAGQNPNLARYLGAFPVEAA